MLTAEFEALSDDQLRNVLGVKWSMYPDCIGAFVAEMDYGTAPVVQDALRAVVDEGFFGYLRHSDAESMRASVAEWYRRETGWQIPAERVSPLPDVVKGFEVAITEFARPRARVIVPTPAYMPFLSVPKSLGREMVEVPMISGANRWEFDYSAIDAALAESPDGAVFIICNPCNPVGRVFDRDELEKISEIVEKHDGRVFSDEIHAPLIYQGQRHIPYASISDATASHTITAASASKAWNLAGLKCAQLILSNDADAEHWKEVGVFIGHGASTIGVIANCVAFAEGQPWLNEVMGYLDGNRKLLANLLQEHLPEVGYIQPEGTYLAWLDFRKYALPEDLGLFFREEAKVAVVNGTACGESGKGYVRFNFAMSRDTLSRAIQQMATAVKVAVG